jgi:hypothetical protein
VRFEINQNKLAGCIRDYLTEKGINNGKSILDKNQRICRCKLGLDKILRQ